MHGIARFFNQENKAYRNMYIVMTLLGIHFIIPSLNYAFAPDLAIGQLISMGDIFGQTLPFSEDSIVWRILAAGNVFSLGFMCFMLAVNVKRFFPVLIPLCVLKAFASLGFLLAFITGSGGVHYVMFLGVFIWDGLNVFFFIYFCTRARNSLLLAGASEPVPRLLFEEGQGMRFTSREKRWLVTVMDTVLPGGASEQLPWSGTETGAHDLADNMIGRLPFLGAIGLRASLWVAYLFPLIIIHKPRTLAGLGTDERELYMKKLYEHPVYFIRQTIILIKSVGCMAYCIDERVQEKLGLNTASQLVGAGE